MEKAVEIRTIEDFDEGYWRERRRKWQALEMGEVAVEVEGKSLMASGMVRGNSLEKGMVVLGRHGDHYDLYEVLGISDKTEKYGNGGVAFDTVKEAFKSAGVRSLKALEDAEGSGEEYGHGYYLWLRDLGSVPEGVDREGGWGYLYNGRWSLGSGANPVSWTRLRSIEEVMHGREVKAAVAEAKRAGDRVRLQKDRLERMREQLMQLEQEAEEARAKVRELKAKK